MNNEREHRCAKHRNFHLFSDIDITACIGCVLIRSSKLEQGIVDLINRLECCRNAPMDAWTCGGMASAIRSILDQANDAT